MEQLTLPVGALQCNCYILWEDPAAAVVIDPGDEAQRILARLQSSAVRPGLVLNTHGHFDHIGAVSALQRAFGAPYRVHGGEVGIMALMPAGTRLWGLVTPEPPTPDGFVTPDESIEVGGLRMKALHTPGHTPGSTCYYVPAAKAVFTGDTLFLGSIGRSDFPGGDGEQLLRSIREGLLTLPRETRVFPGHGPPSTIGDEAENNPFLA